jgi:Spherulation-specific family 4
VALAEAAHSPDVGETLMFHVKFARCLALVLTMATIGPLAETLARADDVVALVPAYFYPTWWVGSFWDDLNAAAARIPVEAIMNPASGPGTASNPDYVVAVCELQKAGGKVIGYVPTGYGFRCADDILCDVSAYLSWYGVNGIFLDEMGNQPGGLDYVSLYASIKHLGAAAGIDLHVVGNPGEPFADAEAFIPAADVLVIFEGPYTNSDPTMASFQSYPNKGPYTVLSPWWLNYDSSQIANIVYDTSTPFKMLVSAIKAIGYNAGYIYITDDQLPNPYDTLPSYWSEEVCLIEFINSLP